MTREYPILWRSLGGASLLAIGETSSRVLGPQVNHLIQCSCIYGHKLISPCGAYKTKIIIVNRRLVTGFSHSHPLCITYYRKKILNGRHRVIRSVQANGLCGTLYHVVQYGTVGRTTMHGSHSRCVTIGFMLRDQLTIIQSILRLNIFVFSMPPSMCSFLSFTIKITSLRFDATAEVQPSG